MYLNVYGCLVLDLTLQCTLKDGNNENQTCIEMSPKPKYHDKRKESLHMQCESSLPTRTVVKVIMCHTCLGLKPAPARKSE